MINEVTGPRLNAPNPLANQPPIQPLAHNIQQQQQQASNILPNLTTSILDPEDVYEIPEDIYKIAPDLRMFDKLLEYERKIDKMIQRKKVDIQEQLLKPLPKLNKVLRLHIFNYYGNQEMGPFWSLRIQGKLLNNPSNMLVHRKFSYFFREINIIFDENRSPDYPEIIWKKQTMNSETDGFEIKKNGNREIEVQIRLHLYSNPQKYKIKEKLAEIIGYEVCSRITALAALWEYIKINRLQDKEDKSKIICDTNFKEIFECDRLSIDTLTLRLRNLLEPPEPIIINHKVKLTGERVDNESMYDIAVECDYPINFELMPFMGIKLPAVDEKNQPTKYNQENFFLNLTQKIKKLEKRCTDTIDSIKQHKFKRDCYKAYSTDPSLYIENLIFQQNQLLKVMYEKNTLKSKLEDPYNSNFYENNEEWVRKNVKNYIDTMSDSK